MSKVAAVVVFYNPEINVLNNLNTYINQIDKLFVVDNSYDNNSTLLEKLEDLSKIEYISNKNNIGIAAALNIGAKKAIEEGFDHLLTMDQDSEASPSLVPTLLEGFSIGAKVALVSPVVYHRKGKNIINKSGKSFEQVITNWTSGSLLDLNIFKETGGFKEELFIDYVDHEFCLRLNKLGYKIYVCNRTFLKHNLGKIEEINLIFRKVYPTNHSAIRLYYRARNRFYVKKIYKKLFPDFFKQDNKDFWKSFLKVILFERDKFEKIKYFFWGYLDYKKNKFGKLEKLKV
jgi:rhamnosyltransferase